MKLRFEGSISDLEEGLAELCPELGIIRDEQGVSVTVEKTGRYRLEVSVEKGRATIRFKEKIHFFRGLGLLMEKLRQGEEGRVEEVPRFTMNGAMFDCSRNAVLRPETIRMVMRRMALMGLNMLMLYTEDTYEVPKVPYFGYLRGRYAQDEIRSLDAYAARFGIELIPCIQTLAHLASFLQWKAADGVRDTEDVLLAGSKETHSLIEKMVDAVASAFSTRRIHIGMDEAFALGRGRYLDRHGYRRPFDIMSEHLQEVLTITREKGLQPMIWSDMFFRLGSRDHAYYDLETEIPEEAIRRVPQDVRFVYWDYYHTDPDFYRQFIAMHRRFGSDPVFAGGVWTWNGPAINYDKSFRTTDAALTACKETGIREVFATLWGDDGAETNMLSGLLGLQFFAEHGYADRVDRDQLYRRFALCVGAEAEDFLTLGRFDLLPGANREDLTPDNPTKFLLWQDPLLGLFDRHVEGIPVASYYSNLSRDLERCLERSGTWRFLFETPLRLAETLILKGDLGIRLKKAYEAGDRETLGRLAEEEIPELYRRVESLRHAHRAQWLETMKPFGWEVLDIRYGGLLTRLESTGSRLVGYLKGEVQRIEELEEKRLFFDSHQPSEGVGKANLYSRIASPSVMGFR
ncbi:beta-N-acetylhexosaminidase [Salinithrix halophila]|uniref:Beta-N-acetylhexosaminidase n=1 Tax=Salinithrix halophila TaxID=1485204 RepID=A0ABV8JAA4_9BACL